MTVSPDELVVYETFWNYVRTPLRRLTGDCSTYRGAAAEPRCNVTTSALVLILSPVELQRGDVACRATDRHNEIVRARSVDDIGRARRSDSDAMNDAGPGDQGAENRWPQHDRQI